MLNDENDWNWELGIEIKLYHWEIEMLKLKIIIKIKIVLRSKVVKCWKIVGNYWDWCKFQFYFFFFL